MSNNKDLLKEVNIEIIEFLRSELPVSSTVDKAKTVDLLVKADNEYLHTRNFIYFTNIYSRKVIRGEEYDYSTKFLHIDFTYGFYDSAAMEEENVNFSSKGTLDIYYPDTFATKTPEQVHDIVYGMTFAYMQNQDE